MDSLIQANRIDYRMISYAGIRRVTFIGANAAFWSAFLYFMLGSLSADLVLLAGAGSSFLSLTGKSWGFLESMLS